MYYLNWCRDARLCRSSRVDWGRWDRAFLRRTQLLVGCRRSEGLSVRVCLHRDVCSSGRRVRMSEVRFNMPATIDYRKQSRVQSYKIRERCPEGGRKTDCQIAANLGECLIEIRQFFNSNLYASPDPMTIRRACGEAFCSWQSAGGAGFRLEKVHRCKGHGRIKQIWFGPCIRR